MPQLAETSHGSNASSGCWAVKKSLSPLLLLDSCLINKSTARSSTVCRSGTNTYTNGTVWNHTRRMLQTFDVNISFFLQKVIYLKAQTKKVSTFFSLNKMHFNVWNNFRRIYLKMIVNSSNYNIRPMQLKETRLFDGWIEPWPRKYLSVHNCLLIMFILINCSGK